MRVYLGSDHAGFELKEHLVAWLTANGHDPVDCGPAVYDAVDDYLRRGSSQPRLLQHHV